MKIEMLANRTGYRKDIEEIRDEWTEELLNFLGIETGVFRSDEYDQGALLEYLIHEKVHIIDYPGIEAQKIYFEGDLVGEWAGPEFTLFEDKDGQLYYKITIETWSIIEEDIELN